MAKQNRGKAIRREDGFRGTCPVCKRQRVRLAWTVVKEDGTKVKACKQCAKQPPKKHS